MHKKIASDAKPVARKTRKRSIAYKKKEQEKKNEEGSGLLYSLHKWGEDYYEAEDYYEKTVNGGTSKTHNDNDHQKKAGKQ
ncbi:MAG: hypothetical protein V3S58_00720 [Nitrosomonadaceae bacterium]